MADTSVVVFNADGQSAFIDYRTESTNGEGRQVVVLGDPATNAGVAPVDATAGLKVDLGADNDVTVAVGGLTQDTNNSTTATLAASATYTGTATNVLGYNQIHLMLKQSPNVDPDGDANTAQGSLYVEFSPDGTNWDVSIPIYVRTGTFIPHTYVVIDKWFRVRYVNDGGSSAITDLGLSETADTARNQTAFRLNSYLVLTGTKDLGRTIDQSVSGSDPVALNRSVLMGKSDAGTYINTTSNNFGAVRVEPEQHIVIGDMNAVGSWAVLNDDAANLATTKKHVVGTDALSFDKANGTANTVFAIIEDTITSIDLGNVSAHDVIRTSCYLSSLTDVVNVLVRIGTDSSNYNEWRIPVADLTAAVFQSIVFSVGAASHAGITGNGWNPAAVTYVAVGVEFGNQTDTLSGIIFDRVSFHTNMQSAAILDQQVTSSVSSSNINVQKVGGSATDTNSGNKSAGSQRVVVATDDINLSAIKTAIEIVDDWDESDRAKVNPVVGQAGVAANSGVVGATTQRVVHAVDVSSSVNIVSQDLAQIDMGSTASIFTVSGSSSGSSASGITLVSPSANYSFKVFAYAIQTTGVLAGALTFKDGNAAGGTEFWRPLITSQSPADTTDTPIGANLAVAPPGFIFATGTSKTLAIHGNNGAVVHYSVSYIKETA